MTSSSTPLSDTPTQADPSPFVHLHVHSHYSLLSGLSKMDPLLDAVQEHGMDTVALTDYGSMYGAIEFYKACQKREIKPIMGLEVYVAPFKYTQKRPKIDTHPSMLVLLARNMTGYKNLIQLTTKAHMEGFYYKPRVDEDLLEEHKEGLIALSGGLGGNIPRLLITGEYDKAKETALQYQKRYGEGHFYLELQIHPTLDNQAVVNEGLLKIADETGIPLVATNDVHYLVKEDAEAQDIVTCIQQQRMLNDPKRRSFAEENYALRSIDEMVELFTDYPEAIANTRKIADMCTVEITLGETQLPYFPVPEGSSEDAELRTLCENGYQDRYGVPYSEAPDEHKERLDYELDIIKQTGFPAYFLIVQDFVNWAKEQGIIVGPGRGSAAGSFASYLLKIVDLDPIKYDLLFERFLNPERVQMPDIDLDFADTRRDDVIQYVTEKYGADRVAHIITFGTMAAKGSVRDVGRVMGFPYETCDRISKMIPMFTSLSDSMEQVPELKTMVESDPQIKRLTDAALKVEGNARHASTHACAMVITKDPLTESVPLQHGSHEGDIVTQFSMKPIEDLGILKIDFLGLKNLSIIERCIDIVHATHEERIDLKAIPMDDAKTFELLQAGGTTGVFQLESSGMKRYLKQLKPTEFEDIIAMVSLYRPGPMEWIPDYIAGKHGTKKVKYVHPVLEPILKDTYGVAIYQEQVMRIARDLAGFTLGEADVLRKAMGKKIKELLDEQKEKFIQGCVDNRVDKAIAEKVFSFIEPFAGYGFNRSHAACYAMISYQTAYLKAHYPSEFMAALLAADQENMDRVTIEITECEAMGINVLAPDVNESFKDFAVVPREGEGAWPIRFGLAGIKNLGSDTIDALIGARKEGGPFADFEDFARRVPIASFNKRGLESLAKSGALDAFAERAQILASMDTILTYMKQVQKAANTGQKDLFAALGDESATPQLKLTSVTPALKAERLAWEKELLGLYVSAHPADEYKPFLRAFTVPLNELSTEKAGIVVRTGGLIMDSRQILTKSGKRMAFIKLEDLTSHAEVVVFPKLFEETAQIWEEGELVILETKIDDRDGELKLLAEKVKRLDVEKVTEWQEQTPEEEQAKKAQETLTAFQAMSASQPVSEDGAPTDEQSPQKKHSTPPAEPLSITMTHSTTAELMEKVRDILATHPGKRAVRIVIPHPNGKNDEIMAPQTVADTEDLHTKLEGLLGEGSVVR
ncbi:MAG: DNA polymerase III subunit alpha [Candidatus Doudnabacteria bacterium]|nr:DNA polymerase III subunit alpha [Candidatus Doudnabacteria bacterium]